MPITVDAINSQYFHILFLSLALFVAWLGGHAVDWLFRLMERTVQADHAKAEQEKVAGQKKELIYYFSTNQTHQDPSTKNVKRPCKQASI